MYEMINPELLLNKLNAYSNAKINNSNGVDKTYYSLLISLIECFKRNKKISVDMLEFGIEMYYKYHKYKKHNHKNNLSDLLKYIDGILKINASTHWLLLPLESSVLKKTFNIGKNVIFYKIKHNFAKTYSEISKLIKVKYNQVKFMLEHTKQTREPNIMKANLLFFKMIDQTEYIKSNGVRISNVLLYLIDLLHQSNKIVDNPFIALNSSEHYYFHHGIIISNNNWRCGNYYRFDLNLIKKYDLSFLRKKKIASDYSSFAKILLKKYKNDIQSRIFNALMIFGKAEYERLILHDDSIAFILYIVALEMMLCKGRSDKAKQLSITVAEMLGKNKSEKKYINKKILDFYDRRNNYVHAGVVPYLYENHIDLCNELSIIVAKLIYFALTCITKNKNITSKSWEKFVKATRDSSKL